MSDHFMAVKRIGSASIVASAYADVSFDTTETFRCISYLTPNDIFAFLKPETIGQLERPCSYADVPEHREQLDDANILPSWSPAAT